jgi:hypothetical protein
LAFAVGSDLCARTACRNVGTRTLKARRWNPVETLTRTLGAECATALTEVAVAAVADLEAATACTGEPTTDDAAGRIARTMVRRITANPRLTIATLAYALVILQTVQKGELPHGTGDSPRGP